MIKKFFLFCAFLALICCNNQTLDLSKISFNEDSKQYDLDKFKVHKKETINGHYEVKENSLEVVDNGEKVFNYIFMDKSISQLNFANMKINPTLGAKVVDYNGKIGFISVNIEPSESEKLIKYLFNNLNKPTEVISNERLEEAVNLGASEILLKSLPQYTKIQKGDFGNNVLIYPQNLIWIKNDIIYQLTLEPSNNNVVNVLNIISKKTLEDKVIMGYHNPEKDPILGKYLN